MRTSIVLGATLVAALLVGCDSGKKQPDFPDLHPVKGVVKKGGSPVAAGGSVQFKSTQDDKAEFMITGTIGADGTFNLSTVRSTDSRGERKSGAPAGTFKVTYSPPYGDQTTGGVQGPIILPNPVTIKAGENDLTLDIDLRKK